MALFSSVFRQLFERFAHFLRRRESPLSAQQCAAQERAALEKLPEAPLMKAGETEAFDFTAKNRKCRRRRRQVTYLRSTSFHWEKINLEAIITL